MPLSTPFVGQDHYAVSPNCVPPLRILVVEDNSDLCELVCELLRIFGHTVIPAGNGEEVIASLNADCSFDVLLSDVSLPGMSGIDLARKVRALMPAIQIVFATGYSNGLAANIDFPAHLFTKPYDIDELQQLLATFKAPVVDLAR